MNHFSKGWYVAYTKPRHEVRACNDLRDRNIDCFLPMAKKLCIWAGRKKYIDTPLFSSYLFINLESSDNYFTSLGVQGILHYVRTGKEIARVKESTIQAIQLLIKDQRNKFEVSSEDLRSEKKLIIKDGPFTGYNCEMIEHNGEQKILVRIELIQRNILLSIAPQYLMPA